MFAQKLNQKIIQKNSRVCVGLDPRLEWLPKKIKQDSQKKHGLTFKAASHAIQEFNHQIIETIAPYAAAVKPQIAFYEQYGPEGLKAFRETIKFAKRKKLVVIADTKRNDIGSTTQAYANSLLGRTNLFRKAKPCYDVDCITVNPFLGEDSLLPFIETCKKYGKGIFVLVKTSNPGSQDLQDLKIKDQTISERMAQLVNKYAQKTRNNQSYSNIGAVVGATFPREAKKLRKLMPNSVFLVPGYGTQGGKAENLKNFFNQDKLGAIVNSSRGIVFSYLQKKNGEKNYLQMIKDKAVEMRDKINNVLQTL